MTTTVQSVDAFSHQGYKAPRELNHYNEDRLVVGRNVFAVVDGATAVVDVDMNGLNPSAYMAKFLSAFLLEQDMDDDRTAVDLLTEANAAIRAHLMVDWPQVYAMGKLGPSAAVAVVKFHKDGTLSVASAADCSVVVRKRGEGWNVITPVRKSLGVLSGELYDLVRKELDEGKTLEEVRTGKAVRDMLQRHRLKANVTFGTFNHEPEAVPLFFSTRIALADVEDIAIFSDGMDWPDATTHEEQCTKAANFMAERGVAGYHSLLKAHYASDEDFTTYPRFKHMDDATGIVLRLRH